MILCMCVAHRDMLPLNTSGHVFTAALWETVLFRTDFPTVVHRLWWKYVYIYKRVYTQTHGWLGVYKLFADSWHVSTHTYRHTHAWHTMLVLLEVFMLVNDWQINIIEGATFYHRRFYHSRPHIPCECRCFFKSPGAVWTRDRDQSHAGFSGRVCIWWRHCNRHHKLSSFE